MIAIVLLLINADFPICTASGYNGYPSVHYVNDQFYVYWVDQRLLPNMSIFGARISKDGTVLDPDGVGLYVDSAGYSCDVGFDGSDFLVVSRNYC